ncbi:winged helix-turn-helix transcriptional regulator [Acidiplasma cupricumulans]|uniref:Lrp/AsnC family transcriptional regulator n=1 Tax=Acidiplasma cupricumulans TaxID=312540 RepID=UPI001585D0E8|nr:winged helix-turn-helix transcriptional regulator [Acidiplasma cupricumulans]
MDEIDKRILTSLLGDGRSTLRQISKNLGISPQSLQYRLNKFQANNIIKKICPLC